MIIFIHRNLKAGYSINKVSQTFIRQVEGYREYYVPCNRADLLSLLKNFIYVYKHRDRHCVNHITGDIHYGILALMGCKSVLTVHDTNIYDFCKHPLKRWIFRWLWFKIPIKLATKVVCISLETKRRVQQFTNREDIEVVYNAVDDSFIAQKFQSTIYHTKPHILLIGTSINKNVVRTIKALQELECVLIIIGQLTDDIVFVLNESQTDYIVKSNLTDSEIIDEYHQCDIVSFCSTYEGFGMPIIEANAIGRPIITSRIEPLIEVAGDAAMLVDPYDVNDMHRGFQTLISDKLLRERLVKNGFKNIQRFQSEKIARQYKEIYKSL